MNFDFPWMKREAEEEEQEQEEGAEEREEKPKKKFKVNPQEVGDFESGTLKLADEEISWINKHYTLMQASRNNFVSENKKAVRMGANAEDEP